MAMEDKPPSIAPWEPYTDVISKTDEELEAYYDTIYKEGLTGIQRTCLDNHCLDLKWARTRRDLASSWSTVPFLALVRYLANATYLLAETVLSSPAVAVTHFFTFAYALAAFTLCFIGLSLYQTVLTLGHYLNLNRTLRAISDREARGQTLVSWPDVGFYTSASKDRVFSLAFAILGSPPPPAVYAVEATEDRRTRKDGILFDVDVAKALVVLCGLVYERDDEWVRKAAESKNFTKDWLLRSEELIYSCAKRWGLEFTSISDFETVAGPFVGAFFKLDGLEEDQHPFCVVVFKGTTPTSVVEWAVDCTLSLSSSADFLGSGRAHSGFYSSVFPAPSTSSSLVSDPSVSPSSLSALPYSRILATVKLIAERNAERFGRTGKRVQLFVAGHSLGAGMASLFYARLLDSPQDVWPGCDLRDAYLYGCPRACDGDLVGRVEHGLRDPANSRRMVFRVVNCDHSPHFGDLVTHVPPGLCDERRNRSVIGSGSLLSYGHIGVAIRVTPNAPEPYYSLGPVIPVGSRLEVVSFDPDPDPPLPPPPTTSSSSSKKKKSRVDGKNEKAGWLVRLSTGLFEWALPSLADHGPTGYFTSLEKVVPKHV